MAMMSRISAKKTIRKKKNRAARDASASRAPTSSFSIGAWRSLVSTSFPWQIMRQFEGEGRFGGRWTPQSGNGGHHDGSGR